MVKNVLVTASGGLVGQGVLRSLRNSKTFKLVTGDPDPNTKGHLLGDHRVQLPMANDAEYVDKVLNICLKENISYVIIGSDTELQSFAVSRKRFKDLNINVIVSDPTVINIADDKLLTAVWLEQYGFPFPKTMLLEVPNVDKLLTWKFPVILKPKKGGRRSYGVKRVDNLKALTKLWSNGEANNVVVQEELQGDEFTAGVLCVNGSVKAVCVLKRDLRDGNTFNAYHDEACDKFIPKLTEIARALKPEGPCNFQFRVKDNEPTIFEINARFSGTTPLRMMFGFNEVEALLNYYESGTEIEQPSLQHGTVYRVTSDVFVSKDEVKEFPFMIGV